MDRTTCLWIPQFELRARLVATPTLRGRPLILADAATRGALVIDASAEAQQRGIHCDLPLNIARTLCPEALILPPDRAFVQQLRQRVLVEIYRLAPIVGSDGEDTFFLSLEGLQQLHPDEHTLAHTLRQRMLETFQLPAAIAIADGATNAWVVARAIDVAPTGTVVIVPRGQAQTFLAALPLQSLPMPPRIAQICRLLGLERTAALQQLPAGALLRRFGHDGLQLEQRVRGHSRELFRVEIPTTIEQSEIYLDQPTAELEPLLFLHKSVLDRLLKQIALRRRAIAALELTLVLASLSTASDLIARSKRSVTHVFRPVRPTLESKSLFELMALWLRTEPVDDLVEGIVMRAIEVGTATVRQLRLFERQEDQSEEALQLALTRLMAAFGRSTVVQPQLSDNYLPEERLQWVPVDPTRLTTTPPPATSLPQRRAPVLHLLTPTLPLDWQRTHLRLEGSDHWRHITACDGPYTIESQWWEPQGFRRAYALVTVESRETWWVYHDEHGYHLQAYLD